MDLKIFLYADDAKLFRYIRNEEDSKKLQDDLNNIKIWSDAWMLKLNINKCKAVSYGRHINHDYGYYIKENETCHTLQKVDTINDLGITFDMHLKFDEHIYAKINKAYSMLGIIKRNFRTISDESFVLLYKSLVRPHLEYANVVWSPYRQKYIEGIEKVQKRATKLIVNNPGISYIDRLKKLNLPTLVYRRHRGDMIETFKIMHGLYNVDSTLHFILSHNVLTRGHRFKLFHTHVHYDLRKYFFVNRIVSLWNSLPDYVVSADTVNSFKNRLDKHWLSQDFKFNWKAKMPETGN
jgi:ribonuclease P/MRP protein subunit RPP40